MVNRGADGGSAVGSSAGGSAVGGPAGGSAVGGPAGGSPAGGSPVGGGEARRAAQAELAHRAYHRDDPGLTSRVLHWLGQRLGELFTGGTGSHALLVTLVVLGALAIVFAVRAGVPGRTARSPGAGEDPLAVVAARDHRRIAAELTLAGRHADALREWLRAAIATIEERGILPPRPGRTGAATAIEAGALLPAAAPGLRAATRAFDEVWFGGRAATDTDVAQARDVAQAVQTARVVLDAPVSAPAVPR